MAKTYEQIQKQIASLQAEAEKLRQQELGEVIGRIRQAIEFYGITAADLGLEVGKSPRAKAPAAKRKSAAPKPKSATKSTLAVLYKDETGNSWVGRGKRPQWLRDALAAGHTLEEFRVAAAT